MTLDNFKKCIYLAYQKDEVSKEAIMKMNELALSHGLKADFSVEGLDKVEQPNLVFFGASEKSLKIIEEKQPKLTIIVPTWNRSDFLCRCVDSILQQSYQNIEIIIINDCSTDNTSEVVKEKYGKNKKIIYIENETNLGPGGNRQKAYLVSSGEYVIFADDDDYYFEPDLI